MSSVPAVPPFRRFAPVPGAIGPWALPLLTVFLFGVAAGCRPNQAVRVNPGVEPPQYRVVCIKSFRNCQREVKDLCGREFVVLEQHSNKPEQVEVNQSYLSSTGPSEGPVDWRGEMTVQCGRAIKPIRLARGAPESEPVTPGTTGPAATAEAEVPASSPSAPPTRWCVPGVTQACLGPGACSGAQACLPDGSGFGSCDCGPNAAEPEPQAPVPAVSGDEAPASSEPFGPRSP